MGALLSLALLNVVWMLPIGLFLAITADDDGMFPYLKSSGKFMLVICAVVIFLTLVTVLK
ncbi:MAG: hypothetical protein IKI57_05390 [Clostridia bacterium]|nr:hypothetical protein [Clostridia bacterium]